MSAFSRRLIPILTAGMMVFWLAACAGESQADAGGEEGSGEHAAMESYGEGVEAGGEHNEGGEGGEHEGEHGGEAHDEGDEESGVYLAKAETWDVERRGAQLVLSFDAETNAFVGTVENKTPVRLCAIRVEVHLDTGTELGPTERVNLDPGAVTQVTLATEGEAFETFTAHPEMSPCG